MEVIRPVAILGVSIIISLGAVGSASAFHKAGGDIAHGKTIYRQTCAACHGASGSGNVPGAPKFKGANSPLSKSDSTLLRNVTNGFRSAGSPMAMPPKGGNASLSSKDIKDVIAYMHSAFGG